MEDDKKGGNKRKGLTVFETIQDENFLVSTKHSPLPKTGDVILADEFSICLTSKRDKLNKYWCELRDQYIFVKKAKDKEPTAFMDINYSRIKLILDDVVNQESVHCIKFIKLRSYEEIFSPDYDKIMRWFEALKRFCVLSRFREYFSSIKVLGKGNFAKVFMVEEKSNKRQFAVKIFDKQQILSDELERKCLLYELLMMRVCDHRNVLRLREIYEGENYIYCLCDLLSGGHLLNKMIKTGFFSEAKSLRLMRQLLESLKYLCSKDIIHRDIKPENIIFRTAEDDSEIVLVDLGFATYCADYNKQFTRCGTPGYVAPEVLHDKKYNCKADIFSAGTIFYIMLTGSVPFSAKTYEGLVEANMRCKIDFNFDSSKYTISDESLDLLKRMLDPNPDKRPSAVECLDHPIFKSHKPVGLSVDTKNLGGINIDGGPQGNLKKPGVGQTDMPDNMDDQNSPVGSPLIRNAKQGNEGFALNVQQMG